MTDSPDELIAFILKQYDEDERVAQLATPGPWEARLLPASALANGVSDADVRVLGGDRLVAGDHEGFGACQLADAEHIALNDPASVLADIKAKRKVIEEFQRTPDDGSHENGVIRDILIDLIRAQAERYASRDGYKETWRP